MPCTVHNIFAIYLYLSRKLGGMLFLKNIYVRIRVEIIVYLTSSVYLIHLIQYQQNSDLRMPIRSTLLSVMHSNTISKSLHKTFLILSADCPIHSRFLYYLKCVALYSYSWNVNNVYVYIQQGEKEYILSVYPIFWMLSNLISWASG